eukprot:gene23569-9093_t
MQAIKSIPTQRLVRKAVTCPPRLALRSPRFLGATTPAIRPCPAAPITRKAHVAKAAPDEATPTPEPALEAPAEVVEEKGVKVIPALQAIAVGLVIRFLIPIPGGITTQGWTLLSIFVSTILGLVLAPLPVGAWALIAVTVTLVTGTLTFGQAFSAMTNEVIWLIVVSFFFAKGFEKTGLGERIANIFVKAMGKSTLGLSLGLNVAEAVLAPAMPSTSARAGGIFMPIIKSLSNASGSYGGEESRKRMGSYLTQSQFQTGIHSSSLFLTASAQNLLCLDLAKELGAVVPNQFFTWMAGAALPAIVVTDTPEAPKEAAVRLEKMGPMSTDEKCMLGTMAFAVALWIVGPSIGISAVVAALIGLSILLCTGTLSWKDCLTYTPAWDTLTWFAVLIGLSGQLNNLGVISAFADSMGSVLATFNLPWMAVFGILHIAFFYLHYMFASQTAHVGALYSAFCAMMLAAGVPPILAAMSLAYSINLFGSMTHYASGQAAVYYGSGFMGLGEVFSMGAINGFVGLVIWAGLGMPVWKMLGWW